jgi:hypothetical protein
MNKAWVGVSEYDRFGPWIDEVETLDDMPPLYRDYPVDLEAAQLVLKVPRNIARRDATPDMDLYNHVLILEKASVTVLSRHTGEAQGSTPRSERGYDALVLAHDEIAAIRDVATLLDGRLTIATSKGVSITVRYNTASRAMISSLVDQLQAATKTQAPSTLGEALLSRAPKQAGSAESLGIGRGEKLLVSEFMDARRSNSRLRPWASHGRKRVRPRGEGLKATLLRVTHALSPMTVHGAVFSTDGSALEIFSRKAWLVRESSADHSAARLVMPLSAIDSVEMRPHELYPEVTITTLHAGEWSTDMALPHDCEAHRLFGAVVESH